MADPEELLAARSQVAELVARREHVLQAPSVDRAALREVDQHIGRVVDQLHAALDACDAGADDPLVLLPVRLETRFGDGARGPVLRVRIYPDEIHLDPIARGLTAEEAAAGHAYWRAVWPEPPAPDAWALLLASVGARRAEWVAHATTPTNLAERGTGADPAAPDAAVRNDRNVVARALPDRFVVHVVQGGRVHRAMGRPVPRDLPMGLLPLEGEVPEKIGGALTITPGCEWLVDVDAAVAVGMAVEVPVDAGPVDRVVVLGTRATDSPESAAEELEDLLTGHRFGAGLGLLAQGVPTNNADAERSPFRPRRTPVEPSPVPPAEPGDTDVRAVAEALGVSAALLASLVGEGRGEQAIARDVNTALWPPGWGEFLRRLDDADIPGVDDAQRTSARLLFRDHVRGRGPVPAIHVGAQPYGVLPVSDLRAWQARAGDTTAGIAALVRRVLDRWARAAAWRVPRIRRGDDDLEATVLEVLGSSPVMQGLRVRPVVSEDVAGAVSGALGLDRDAWLAEQVLTTAVTSSLLGPAAAAMKIGSLHTRTRALPMPLVSERDGEFIDALLEQPSRTLAVDSVLQALLVLSLRASEQEVVVAAPAEVVPRLLDYVELEAGLLDEVRAVASQADRLEAGRLHRTASMLEEAGVAIGGPSMLRSFQPVARLETSLAEIALASPRTPDAVELSNSAVAGFLRAMAYRAEVRDAMAHLRGTDTAARGLAVAEALDCSSHRLDAWATAVVASRRSRQVAAGRVRGCTIGAYGVVEELRPQDRVPDLGWIHAPSPRHAVTAGMLRAAHLHHAQPGAEADAAFAIDLSSRRVAAAEHVLQGVRAGQQLGALVGYRIERALQEEGLARLQLSLRNLAPIRAHRLHVTDGLEDDEVRAREAVAATDVVDGVLLLQRYEPGSPALRAALDREPVNQYLDPGEWPALSDGEWSAVVRVLRDAADTIDAVADVLLAESVFQYASGNAARAAAAMDATGRGTALQEGLDVLDVQEGAERLTHRMLAVVGAGAGGVIGWESTRPRALLEPAVEAWCQGHLPAPAQVVLAEVDGAAVTLDAAGLCALDLVFATDDAALDRSLRAAIPALGDAPLAVGRDPGWPPGARGLGQALVQAAALRAVLAGARPLMPADLTRPGAPVTRTLTAGLDDLVTRVGAMVWNLRLLVEGLRPSIESLPEDAIVDDAAGAVALVAAMQPLAAYGSPLAPDTDRLLDLRWARGEWQAAESRMRAAATELAALEALDRAAVAPEAVVEAAEAVVATVFGDGFRIAPVIDPPTGRDALVDAEERPGFSPPAPSAVRAFVRDHATVRRQVRRWSEVLLVGAAGTSAPASVGVVQLVERAVDGSPVTGAERWLAGPIPEGAPWPASPVAHLVLDVAGAYDPLGPLVGLAIDAWVEDLPAQVDPKARPDDPRPARVRTGLAVRTESASARPPQAVLCAVSPDGQRWTESSLRAVVEQTLELARARLVTLERLTGEARVLPALQVQSASLQGEPAIDLSRLVVSASTHVSMPWIKER